MALAECSDKAFLDHKYRAYFFQAKSDLEQYCSKTPGARPAEKAEYIDQRHKDRLYDNGADYMRLLEKDSGKYVDVAITESDVRRGFYNHDTNRTYIRYAITKSKELLEKLAKCNMIAAVRTPPREEKETPKIIYGAAKMKDDEEKFMILFTTMQAFKKWNESNTKKSFAPVYLNSEMIENIREGRGILINPYEENMILESKTLESIINPASTSNPTS